MFWCEKCIITFNFALFFPYVLVTLKLQMGSHEAFPLLSHSLFSVF